MLGRLQTPFALSPHHSDISVGFNCKYKSDLRCFSLIAATKRVWYYNVKCLVFQERWILSTTTKQNNNNNKNVRRGRCMSLLSEYGGPCDRHSSDPFPLPGSAFLDRMHPCQGRYYYCIGKCTVWLNEICILCTCGWSKEGILSFKVCCIFLKYLLCSLVVCWWCRTVPPSTSIYSLYFSCRRS